MSEKPASGGLAFLQRRLRREGIIAYAVWATLVVAIVVALVNTRWSTAFVALATLVVSMLPVLFVERFRIKLPVSFLAAIVLFIFATIFLGEALNFYERLWWWDLFLHAFSAIGFGLIGFLFIFMLFEGNRYAAPSSAVAFFAYCFAVAIGTGWEIFEFAMDSIFGLNMMKSGLLDTMSDLIVDAIGAALGALTGFFYLKGRQFGGLAGMLGEFVRLNRRFFRKSGGGK
ncbi:MAG: hypothetical protein WD674_11425 [Cucumibacter sp.]